MSGGAEWSGHVGGGAVSPRRSWGTQHAATSQSSSPSTGIMFQILRCRVSSRTAADILTYFEWFMLQCSQHVHWHLSRSGLHGDRSIAKNVRLLILAGICGGWRWGAACWAQRQVRRSGALLCAAVRCPGCAGQRQEHNNNDECCPMFYFPE